MTGAADILHHCAGFNRTGFIMCSYLCEAEGMSVDEALDSFAAVRPPGVKHGELSPTFSGTPAACLVCHAGDRE